MHGLHWLGIDWDEGPEVGGPYGPYYQSQRGDRYQAAVDKLLAAGAAYYDYATTEELQTERETAERAKQVFLYSRRFMAETAADRARFEAEGRKPSVRLKMPREGTLVIQDVIRGNVAVDWAREQDHVIQRADGSFLYHLANVVDDFDFKITHVIRAEEHLSNTPRQIFIAQSLGYELPIYAHLPFVAEPGSKTKLSKRKLDKYLKNADFAALMKHGRKVADALGMPVDPNTFNPVVVDFYEQVGYLPEAIINYLALLGWALDDQTEHFSREELIGHFSLERVNRAAASFDPKKLWSFQDRHMQRLPLEQKVERVIPYLQRARLVASPVSNDERSIIEDSVRDAGDRLKTAGDILDFDDSLRSNLGFALDNQVLKTFISSVEDAKRLCDCRDTIRRTSGLDLHARREAVANILGRESNAATMTPPPWYDPATDLAIAEQIEAGNFEESIRDYVNQNAIKLADVIHKLRFALTGKTKGVGVFDIIGNLGTNSSVTRIDRALKESGYPDLASKQVPIPDSTRRVLKHLADLPLALHESRGFFDPDSPEKSVQLYSGGLMVASSGKSISGGGQVELDLAPSPEIQFSLTPDSQHSMPPLGEGELRIPELNASVPVLLSHYQVTSSSGTKLLEGHTNGRFAFGDGSALQRVIFHVTDFVDFFGTPIRDESARHSWAGRMKLIAGGWDIIIDAVPNAKERRDAMRNSGGVPITHVGLLKRSDGGVFSAEDGRELLESLRYFLSFTRGHWVAPLIQVGFGVEGRSVWQDWTLWRIRHNRAFESWCPLHQIAYVESFFPNFLARWENQVCQETIRAAIGSYLESNSQGSLESSIISAVITLETVAEFVLVERAGASESRLAPYEKIAQLLELAGIPKEIPEPLPRLRKVANAERSRSGLEVVAHVRNACLHPTRESRSFLERLASERHAFYDVSRLALWYSDICLLWYLGFEGRYQSRVHAQWVGETEPVPWRAPLRL